MMDRTQETGHRRVERSTCPEGAPGGRSSTVTEADPQAAAEGPGRHAGSESSDTPTSCPQSLEGQILPSSQPDLWSEGGRGKGRGKGQEGLRDPSLTLAHVSPPESHPAELGDFSEAIPVNEPIKLGQWPLN